PRPGGGGDPGGCSPPAFELPMRASLALALVFLTAAAPSAAAAPEKRPGTPPKLLSCGRQTLKKGAPSTYAAIEASIVRGYERAKIPLYWIGLQSSKAPD